MAITFLGAPVGLGILSAAFFFMAFRYREQERFGRFEILYAMGNLFLLAALYIIYQTLDAAGDAFAPVVYPFFALMLWVYFFVLLIMFFKLLKNLVFSIMHAGGKGYIEG